MAHSLLRLKSKIVNVPHMIDSSSFETIVDYVNKRCSGDVETSPEALFDGEPKQLTYNADIQTGVIEISGPLTYKPTMFAALCGGTSYEGLKEDFSAMVDAGAKTIAFIVDSPGGEAYSVFDTANYLRKLADDNGVRILAYVDGLSASAGYALTAIADEVITNSQSELGSIGVVVRLMNDSKALEMEGYERTYVFAGESKTPFADDGSFRPDFISDIQSKVDTLYTEFTEFVATHRNLTVETVKSTQARTFLAKEAIELGLADSSMTVDQFYNYLADTAQRPEGNSMLKNKLFNMKTNEETLDMSQLAELQAQLAQYEGQVAELTSVKETLTTLQSAFAEKEAALTEALAQVASAEAAAVAVKMTSRKTALAAVMSADKVEAVSTSLASLDDSAFETVLSGFAAQKQALEASDMFTEIGDQGTEAVVETTSKAKTSTEDLIKQKLGLI
jgi:ClpP class serine protease